jgi:N-acyl-D-amino-acid deacylase
MQFDLVIKNGQVFDGTGTAPFRGSLGVSGGRIRAVDRDGTALEGKQTIDAEGLAVAPGFIDIHSHSEVVMPQAEHHQVLAPLLEQGITTIVTGNCGFAPVPVNPRYADLLRSDLEVGTDQPMEFEWESHKEFLDYLQKLPPALNVAQLAGHGMIRVAVMEHSVKPADPGQLEGIKRWVEEAFDAGCFGLSFGLGYAPGMFAEPEELDALAKIVAEHDGLLSCHLRAYSWISPFYTLNPLGWKHHNLRAIDEFIGIGERSGARLQISHLIYVGRPSWKTFRPALESIERANDRGVDVAFDTFPYTGGNTTIRVIYPAWAQADLPEKLGRTLVKKRLHFEWLLFTNFLKFSMADLQLLWNSNPKMKELEGLRFDAIGEKLGMHPLEAYFKVTRENQANARVMVYQYSGDQANDEALRATLAHPLNMLETDTILTRTGFGNPASTGSFPSFLGRYCRDQNLLPMETAVYKMTGLPASRLGLSDRGTIREGNWADLTIFDPATVNCHADFTHPDRRPEGIHHVVLNGELAVEDGRFTGRRLGTVLRK